MDESVALDSSKQKDFVKSVRGIKKLLKKKNKKEVVTEVAKADNKTFEDKSNEVEKGNAKKRKNRGLVYLSHIPHGFYEQQMTEYFKQFGVVTNARVIRSRRTGNSKGFAFVEFKEPAVAEIVAETMNNYLMGKRLIKASCIPPKKQRKNAQRKKWNSQNNPSRDERITLNKKHNAGKSDAEELSMAKKLLSNLSKTKQKLRDLGIDYDFFEAVDVPDNISEVTSLTKPKQKNVKTEGKVEQIKSEPEEINLNVKASKAKKQHLKQNQIDNESIILSKSLDKKNMAKQHKGKPKNENKQSSQEENTKMMKKQLNQQQKENEDNLKKREKRPKNFVSIRQSDDSDSSVNFDSDEFEKMIELENEDDLSGDESSNSEDEEIKEKNNKTSVRKLKTSMKNCGDNTKNKLNVKIVSVKRKITKDAPFTAKKAKFENKKKTRLFEKKTKKGK